MRLKNIIIFSVLFAFVALSGCEAKTDAPKKEEASGAEGETAKPEGEGETAKPEGEGEAAQPEGEGEEGANTATKVGLDTGGKSLGGEPVKLNALKFGGEGFDAEYNEALDSWTVEKWKPNADGGNDMVIRIYVDGWNSDDWPVEHAAFAEKLKTPDFLDMGSKWTEATAEAFEGGWVIMGVNDDGEDQEMAFALRHDKLNALCRGYVKTDVPEADRAAVRDDAIAACKASSL